jgi:hypothetical protein
MGQWIASIPKSSNGTPVDALLQTSSGWYGLVFRKQEEGQSGDQILALMNAKQLVSCNTLNADKQDRLEVLTYFENELDTSQLLAPHIKPEKKSPESKKRTRASIDDN